MEIWIEVRRCLSEEMCKKLDKKKWTEVQIYKSIAGKETLILQKHKPADRKVVRDKGGRKRSAFVIKFLN